MFAISVKNTGSRGFVYYDMACYNNLEGGSIVLNIILPPSLQPLVNNMKLINISGSAIGECLDNLVRQYPPLKTAIFDKRRKLQKGLSLYLNGESTSPVDFNRLVTDGDKLYIIDILVGG